MIKISRVDAYQCMDETDFKIMDYELDQLWNSGQRNDREMTHQFFLEDENTIKLVVYWDGVEIEMYRFKNKGKLTEEGKKAIGRPSLGVTKKVSITLPEGDWNRLEEIRKDHEIGYKSEFFREILQNVIKLADCNQEGHLKEQ